ncbi:MAG: phosphatidate phosphatase APP1 [Bradymonadia bacterium]|jgi:phosphatidate phosphatase APP1
MHLPAATPPRLTTLCLTLACLIGLPGLAAADDDPGLILVYPSHGTGQSFTIQGRFIEDDRVRTAKTSASRWRNLRNTLKLLESDEIEGALIQVQVGDWKGVGKTDDDGVFSVVASLPPGKALRPGVHRISATATDDQGHPALAARGALFVLPPKGLAIISDIDDTILHTGVTSKREMTKNALLKNAAQIDPVPGAATAYAKAKAAGALLIFYLSGSPQNFVRRIEGFLRLRKFPLGPLLLKNFGTDPTFDQQTYKMAHLKRVFETHPGLRFILVGDSGEHDPELYAKVRGLYPARVEAVLIRLVVDGDNRPERFANMHVVADHAKSPDVLVDLVKTAALRP